MTWPKVEFQSLFSEPSRNGVYKPKEHHGSGARIINMGELFKYDRIGCQEMARLQMTELELTKAAVASGDLLFGRRSLVEEGAGRCALAWGIEEPTTFESSIIRVRLDQDVADPAFYCYYFRSKVGRARIRSIVNGATVKGIRGSDLQRIEVDQPPLHVQQGIAAYLNNFDDLIETNNRRIILLEESARLLYREWFVNLRFPGYQAAKYIDGVPEGWTRAALSELIHDKPATPHEKGKSYPFVPMQSLSQTSMLIGAREERAISGGAKFRNFDTLLARITPCLENGKTGFVQFLDEETTCASGSTEFIVMRSKTVSPYWVYCLAREESFRQHAIRSMSGADGRQRVNSKCFGTFMTYEPPSTILTSFDAVVQPVFEQVEVLARQNTALSVARDELLPKLMSGEIQV